MLQKINAAILWLKSRFSNSEAKPLKPSEKPPKKPVVEKPRPNPGESETGKPLLWIPFANHFESGMGYQGTYANNYPRGAVVHYTAGRFAGGLSKAVDTMKGGKKNGFTFLVISEDGEVVQGFPLNKWGWHAGQSSHARLSGSVSDELIGIEICNAGLLTKRGDKFVSWYGLEIPKEQVRTITKRNKNQAAGPYHAYTKEQEDALIHLLLWFKRNNPSVFDFDLVLGHDEVTMRPDGLSSRKQDPGGALSSDMETFRSKLKTLWESEKGQA
jgi:N-acetyl-anhydromuramyl-L-alanine amidase AmpD